MQDQLNKTKASAERLLLDADEAAALLGTSRRGVYKLVRSKQLPAVRVGRYLRFRRASLERWIEQQESR